MDLLLLILYVKLNMKFKSLEVASYIFLQRIESWWAQLRKSLTDYWINTFKVNPLLRITVYIYSVIVIIM